MQLTEKKIGDVPPGLIEVTQKARLSKKRLVLLFVSAFLVSAGIVSVHFFETLKERFPKERSVPVEPKVAQVIEKPQLKSEGKDSNLAQREAPEIKPEIKRDEPKKEHTPKPAIQPKRAQKKPKLVLAKPSLQRPVPGDTKTQEETKPKAEQPSRKDEGQDFLLRAYFYEKEGKIKDALAEYKDYFRTTGSKDPKILNKIVALSIIDNDISSALYFAELALKEAPNDLQILLNYGVIKAKLGELDEAEKVFNRILKAEPSNKKALYNLAFLKEKKGEKEEAERLYTVLRNLGDKQAEEALLRIRSYR